MLGNLILASILTVIILSGPFILFAAIKLFNQSVGGLKARIVRTSAAADAEAPLGLLITWDGDSFPNEICRIRAEFSEMVRGGRSRSFSFTFEDRAAKKKSFLLPMRLTADELAMLTDAGLANEPRALNRSYLQVEMENTHGETLRQSISKKAIREAWSSSPVSFGKEIDTVAPAAPDNWSVLTRVFPWRKAVAAAAAPDAAKAGGTGHDKPKAKGPSAPAIVDFIVTKVWIEPGCIVCDACENEAPEIFHVLPDTCIVRENAPVDRNAANIKAAAEGCPVNVIKYNTAPKPA